MVDLCRVVLVVVELFGIGLDRIVRIDVVSVDHPVDVDGNAAVVRDREYGGDREDHDPDDADDGREAFADMEVEDLAQQYV